MGWADDAPQILGTDALPPPIVGTNAAAGGATAGAVAGGDAGLVPGGLNVPSSPAQPPSQASGWGILPPEDIAALRANIRPDGAARFSSALGAGLASAGQNWNKPAGAAFAASAGAAIQGGEKAQQQLVHNQIAALNAAIHAYRAGDMIAYHRSLSEYHQAVGEQRRRQAAPPRPAKPAQEAQAPEPEPDELGPHRAKLADLLNDAGVPADRVEGADLHAAAQLMAAKALPARDAFEVAAMHGALADGHASPAEIDLIYGPGAADAIRSAAAPSNDAIAPPQGDEAA
jgi:hypothetical protein